MSFQIAAAKMHAEKRANIYIYRHADLCVYVGIYLQMRVHAFNK